MKITSLFITAFIFVGAYAQTDTSDSLKSKNIKFNYKAVIIPTALITYGAVGLESHTLKSINSDTSNEIKEHIDEKLTIDDFSQYSPLVSVYALNALGVEGKNNLKDRTIIISTAYLIMGTTVNVIKWTGNELRPDGTSYNSFPSGHTATAFMGAEFLFQEYRHISAWYGVTGYIVAAGTGFFRMYNDRHWFSDVAAGAGIGILSTKIAYWLHPLMKGIFFKNENKLTGSIAPVYNGKNYGIGMLVRF